MSDAGNNQDNFTLTQQQQQLPGKRSDAASGALPPQKRQKKAGAGDEALYVRMTDVFTLHIDPREVRRGRAVAAARALVARKTENRCGRNGYVRPGSVAVQSLSAGRATHGGDIEFDVTVQFDAFCPLANTTLRTCVCTSNNIATISGEVRDAQGNLVGTIFLPREGIVSDAATNDLAFAPMLASAADMQRVQPGDTFGCLVRQVTFELDDPHLSVQGQLLVAGADEMEEGRRREERGEEEEEEEGDDDAVHYLPHVEHMSELRRVLVLGRMDLAALRDQLVREEAARTAGSEFTRAAACRADTAQGGDLPLLAEYSLRDDHTAYITIALQELPLLATSVTQRPVAGAPPQRMPSFLQIWDRAPALRKLLLEHAKRMARGMTSDVRMRNGAKPLDDIVELRWQQQRNFGYRLATTFMPAYAKAVIAHFGARRVLDPCAGWGDRMAGALALRQQQQQDGGGDDALTYVCFDPNRALRRGHRQIAELFGAKLESDDGTSMRFDNGFAAHAVPFEEGAPDLLASDSFDLVFTSPPFFDLEVYTSSNPQYGSDWIGRFYRPLMVQSARCVVPGGHVCIHIDDTSAGKIEPFLRNVVPELTRLKLCGRIALRGVMSNKARSIWVYQKKK
jgi:hypothetical protein